MFDALSERFNNVFRSVRGRGKITEANVREAMREIRTALLEADVHVEVARKFCDDCLEQALGTPGLGVRMVGTGLGQRVSHCITIPRLGFHKLQRRGPVGGPHGRPHLCQ